MKILCIEDDEGLAKLLQRSLVKQHYQVELATDGQMGWDLAETNPYDLILLDWMLPKLTGIEFCQQLRTQKHSPHNQDTPILLMTTLDTVTNKVMGLNAGADDYVVKPLDLDELLARIRALLRRSQSSRSPLLQWGDLCLNPNSCEVTYQGQAIPLAAKEYELLELFLRHPDQIFSLDRLLVALWAVEEMPSEGAVRAHIKGLRQKLKRAKANDPIETIYKLGYRLKPYKARNQENRRDQTAGPPLFSPTVIPSEFWQAWQESRQFYCDRLFIIQQVIIALQNGTLTPEQKLEAEQEAHTLVGSLGSFGLDEASQLARQIQQILKRPEAPDQQDIKILMQLVETLHSHLEHSKTEKTETIATIEKPCSSSSTMTSLLIVEGNLAWAQLLAKEASSWGLQAQIATTLREAQQFLRPGLIDTVLLALDWPDSSDNGLEFLTMIRSQCPTVPIVTLTTEESFEKRVEAARLGTRCFLKKPIAPSQVLSAVTQVLQQSNQQIAHLLIVDDDPALLQLLRTLLEPCGYQVTLLSEPHLFWRTLEQAVPDLLILDVELGQSAAAGPQRSQSMQPPSGQPPSGQPPSGQLPSQQSLSGLSGIELCQVIRSDSRWNRLPVLFLSAHTDIETVQHSFVVGADDFLSKPVIAQELLTRVQTRLAQRQLWNLADLDELTGVNLRRKAQEDLTRLIRLAQRQEQPLSLAVLDLDYFKRVNDQYGHDTGDRVLNHLGKLLRQSFRQEDVVGRWGGEEFIVGMYGITKQDGIKRLQEVLDQLSRYVFLAQNEVSFQVTFSAGIAQLPDDGDELQMLYHFADQALYRAKSAGRNRIFTT